MKLLMISGDRSILQGKRGAFWYTLEEFSRHWDRIDVICPATTYNLQLTTSQPFPNVFFHPSPRKIWYQPWWILHCGYKLIQEHHYDVMTVHEYPPFYNGKGARWLHNATGIPFVIEVHHIVGWPVAASIIESIGAFLSKLVLPREARIANAVRTVNEIVKKQLIAWGAPAEKVHVVPSFYLDPEKLRPDPLIMKNIDVVTAARLVANKGLPELLDAIAQIKDRKLLIIGDGPLRKQLEVQARRLGIENRVTFVGWLPTQEDVIAALQRGKVFVMNSKSEGGPRTALEAMAIGLPVIATKVGVMPEVIQDGVNGVLTDGSVEDLQKKIQMLLQDEGLQNRLGGEAMKIVERFSRKTLIEKYAQFLKDRSANYELRITKHS